MADGFLYVFMLSVVIGLSSFLVGLVPLSFDFGPRKMRLVTTFGTGILVGTALIVVIPEGVETLYSARPSGSNVARSTLTAIPDTSQRKKFEAPSQRVSTGQAREANLVARAYGDELKFDKVPVEGDLTGLAAPKSNDKPAIEVTTPLAEHRDSSPASSGTSSSTHDHDDFEPHAWIGISVLAGFVLMYLIDRLPRVASAATTNRRPSYVFLERLGLDPAAASRGGDNDRAAIEGGEDVGPSTHLHGGSGHGSRGAPSKPMPLTTGLVIHAAADGIALGASSTTQSPNRLPFIIFLALTLHKAPAAFALTAVLLRRNVSKRRIKGYLLVFSLAAPVGTLASWAAAKSVGVGGYLSGGGSESATGFATGVLLLFSGGTFLYVAMHAMQDAGQSTDGSELTLGSEDVYGPTQVRPPAGESMVDILTMLGGMLLPLLTQLGHHH